MKKRTRDNTGRMVGSKELQTAIKETRKANGFSQKTFAERLHVNELTVYRWESLLRVPHRVQLAELLIMSPPEHRGVFQSYLGKTLGQLIFERTTRAAYDAEVSVQDYENEPLRYANEIYRALAPCAEALKEAAASGDERSAHVLLRLLKIAKPELVRVARGR